MSLLLCLCEGVSLLWISVRTERRESLPLKALCVGNMTARPKLRGEMRISNCPSLFSTHITPPSLFTLKPLCVLCWRTKKQRRPDSTGPGPGPGHEPDCLSMKSDWSMEDPMYFKRGQPADGRSECKAAKTEQTFHFYPTCTFIRAVVVSGSSSRDQTLLDLNPAVCPLRATGRRTVTLILKDLLIRCKL